MIYLAQDSTHIFDSRHVGLSGENLYTQLPESIDDLGRRRGSATSPGQHQVASAFLYQPLGH